MTMGMSIRPHGTWGRSFRIKFNGGLTGRFQHDFTYHKKVESAFILIKLLRWCSGMFDGLLELTGFRQHMQSIQGMNL
jgi:hypothetical protein